MKILLSHNLKVRIYDFYDWFAINKNRLSGNYDFRKLILVHFFAKTFPSKGGRNLTFLSGENFLITCFTWISNFQETY